jgi:hypothetical protein
VTARRRQLLFVAALSLSAFLLFTLELLAGREVLPIFGGAPGVWATALCFFSGFLFVGYGYAHLSATRLGPRRGGLVHLVLATSLIAASFLAPASVTTLRNAGVPEALNVLFALLVLVGPPAFLLGSTTPLLSAWFAGTSADAWWLYAASNAASLGGLLIYPFVVEPLLPLSVQRSAILLGLVLFAALLAAIVVSLRMESAPRKDSAPPPMPSADTAPSRRRQLSWLVGAFVPAGLLTATTNFLTTDLVSAPLLWVGPLAIYLASFVIAFSARGRRLLPIVDGLVPAAATLLWLPYVVPVGWPAVPLVVIVLAAFAVLAVAIHGRLAEDTPDPSRLTYFYLILSAAGLLATALVGVVAPLVLPDIYEYPFLLIAGPAVLAILRPRHGRSATRPANPWATRQLLSRLIPFALIGLLLLLFAGGFDPGVLGLLAIGGLVVALAATPRLLACATPAAIVISVIAFSAAPGTSLLFAGRSFFGVSKVTAVGDENRLYSGTTLHGVEFTDSRRGTPTTYYASTGPLGDVFADVRSRTDGAAIGVVGLGSGTIAAYGQTGDILTYFEIDPLVVALAGDTRYFTYLHDSAATLETILGDGRLSLAAVPAGSLDLLVLDAFSSDSVPPHLLTSEAIRTYLHTLRPGAVLAFNLSNRYYDLSTAVGATAADMGVTALERKYVPTADAIEGGGATGSDWVIVGLAPDTARFVDRGWLPIAAGGPVLTDDYPDITRVLRWRP